MPVVLKLNTKPTFFEPIEIEVDDKLFRVREITLGSLEKIQALQGDLAAGSAKAIREALEMLVEGDVKPMLDIPLSKIKNLVTVLVEKAISSSPEEKNGSGPGEKS
jgi:hypothetical protein